MATYLQHFLDAELRIKVWPSKQNKRIIILHYLASKFQDGNSYTEKETNDLLLKWHTFNDPALLRRELYEHKFLDRTRDGKSYWKLEYKEQLNYKST